MYYYFIAPVVRTYQQKEPLTYASDAKLQPGQIVFMEIGRRTAPGVVLEKTEKPAFQTKEISRVIETTPLPQPLLKLAKWLSEYYQAAPAATWQTMLPRGLEKKRREHIFPLPEVIRKRTKIVFNKEQSNSVKAIENMSPGTALLQGVTGSGKTQVYIELAKKILKEKGQSVIILVPEISLTSQTIAEFNNHFKDSVVVTHSTMTESERHAAWLKCLRAKTPQIVIGPRSALFSPLKSLGLIVIDECHEPSFKQEQSPRYSALRAASILAVEHKAKLVLGSATPSITDYFLAEKNNRPILKLTRPANPNYKPANIEVVDMTKSQNFTKHRFLSNKLLENIEASLQKEEQTLIFHNRRGSTPTTMCENCGWHAMCQRCFVPLVLHADSFSLHCHICGYQESVPTACPECHNATIIHKGIGTKLIAEELHKQFPKATIKRFDGDTHNSETVEKLYQELYEGNIDIIVGTQIIAKGLDLPKLSTIGIVQADSGLLLPDFQASERVFQLTAQALGRVGRNNNDSTVIVQSYQPTHPSIQAAVDGNYEEFYNSTLKERERGKFLPYTYLLKLTCVYKTESGAVNAARKLASELKRKANKTTLILGPTPAFYERVRDTYRWQLVIKSPVRQDLIKLLTEVPPTKWQAELDPISLL